MSTRRTATIRLRRAQLVAVIDALRVSVELTMGVSARTALALCEKALAALDERMRT